jgi:hypothetical protein
MKFEIWTRETEETKVKYLVEAESQEIAEDLVITGEAEENQEELESVAINREIKSITKI